MKNRRSAPAVNAGSMADIAFLLLIFFLVATEIVTDKGISIILPEYYEGPPGQVADNNVLNILINKEDDLLIEKKDAQIDEVQERVIDFVLNERDLNNRPSSPQKAIISIHNDKETSYEVYIEVYSQIQAAYKSMRNEAALSKYDLLFDQLPYEKKRNIASIIPLTISEADPF